MPRARRGPFQPGQQVKCINAKGSNLRAGALYTIEATDGGGLVRLREHFAPTAFLPCRFQLVAAPEPVPANIGTLDEYGPAPPAPPHGL